MSNTDLQASLDAAKEDLVKKFTDSRLDAYERGLKDGAIAILDTLLNEELSPIFTADADSIIVALTEYRRRLADELKTT